MNIPPALLSALLVVVGTIDRPTPRDRFVAIASQPASGGTAFLNDTIGIDFTNPVDLSTANLNTVVFDVFDLQGNQLAEVPSGTFRLGRAPGEPSPGRRLLFEPTLPTNNGYTNGGFRPDRRYVVRLAAAGTSGPTLRDVHGRALAAPFSFDFTTPGGTFAPTLFRNPAPGGPARVGFHVTSSTRDNSDGIAYLNKGAQTPVTITLEFDQALNPQTTNVPTAIELDPTKRGIAGRGRVYLEYDDPDPLVGASAWIPAAVELTENNARGAVLQLRPLGVLPNRAEIRVIVEATLEDISGESNIISPAYDRVFARFPTLETTAPQFDAILDQFDTAAAVDPEAVFLEPRAEVQGGALRASFDFEGTATVLDYRPTTSVVLNTDFTQITPVGAPPISVAGGVFQFRNVTIPAGVTVQGTGSNPMVWLVTGDFTVDGVLSVDGGDGESAVAVGAAGFPTAGGRGNCGGGDGGRGSPTTTGRSFAGETGYGPGQVVGGGGGGGLSSTAASCGRASGGAGGSFASKGDPWFPVKAAGNRFAQVTGDGGWGCTGVSGAPSRTLPPGRAGALGFADPLGDNDFWGAGIDLHGHRRIDGELAAPRGGAGGGGGGDYGPTTSWQNDHRGGGGGGGGGVLIVKVLGRLQIGASGRVTANGGHGGGGEDGGGNTRGGGGGGGAGGMVVLMAGGGIRIEVHGETYANGDYDFVVSADGGVGVQSAFGGVSWSDKYPPPASPTAWDDNPAGGFGGLGVIQLMAPAGDDSVDGTGTALDDGIEILRAGVPLTGVEKQRYLAWRGFPNASGVWVDDNGTPTYNNASSTPGYPAWARSADDEGDFRPGPVLLPVPFGHKTRLRSKWIDAGIGAVRLPVRIAGTGPRRITEDPANNLLAGPRYEFAGTNADTTGSKRNWVGYIDYDQAGIPVLVVPILAGPLQVARAVANARFEGQPAYRIELEGSPLGSVRDLYSQREARLGDARSGALLGAYRILGHDSDSLWLSPDAPLLPAIPGLPREVFIAARSFQLVTNGAPGFGPFRVSPTGRAVPIANARIGFAFHKDPSLATRTGIDPNRMPPQTGTFLYDLADPAVQEQVRTFGGGAAFIMWDVVFNTAFSEDDPGQLLPGAPLTPSLPRPELRMLSIPYRF